MKGRDSKKIAVGEIVWVAVREEEGEGESPETCWWPGLIQRVSSLGVFVSFFNLQIPRCFHQSQIHSFDDNFRLPLLDYKNSTACSKRDALLDCALRLLYRRTVLSLRCRCLSQMVESKVSELVGDDGGFEAKRSFRSAGVLGFVQSVAILPWVEVGDFVGAVKRIAQVQAFRGYCAIKQKSVYQKAKRQWGNERDSKHFVVEESNALELDEKCLLLPSQKEMNSIAGVPSGIDTTILLPKECLQPLHEGQLDIKLTQAKQMEAQALYSGTCKSYVKVQECDGSIRFLKDRTGITYAYTATESMSNGFWNDGEVHTNSSLLLPLTNESFFNEAIGTNAGSDTKNIDDTATTRTCSLQFHPTHDKHKMQPHGGEIGTSFKSCRFCYEGPEVFDGLSLRQPSTSESVFNDAVRTNVGTDTMDIDYSAPTGICSLQHHQTCDKFKLQSHGGESDTSVKFNGFWNKGAEVFRDSSFLQSSTSEPVCNKAIGINGATDTKSIHDSSTTGIGPLQFHQTHDIDKMPHLSGENCKFVKSNGAEVCHNSSLLQSSTSESDRVVSSSGGSTRKSKKLLRPCHSSVKSLVEVAEQSKAVSTSDSRSLHMMFPKDYNPPSKEELVKKFCRFGPVDHLKTKFYFYGKSAQVVFYDSSDAVVAYNYAKRRRLFLGQANVLYWLDPFEQERRGTVKQVGPITKSCLKISNSRRNEVKSKRQRVRFLMET